MKKISLIILITSLVNFSCSDFLEENPKDELSTQSNFSEPPQAYNAVNSLYRNGVPQMFDGGVYSGTRAMLGQYMSGFFDNEYKGQEPHVQHTQQLTLNGNNISGYLGDTWDDLYTGISRANNAIKYIPTTPGLEDAELRQLSAEARFFRAYAYYYLVRMFGGVPLITEPVESVEDSLYVPRGSVKDVYNLIESDLLYAVNEGGLSESSMANNGKRVTRGAAATLLAEVYLTMSGFPLQENRYADAATMARSVINSGTYGLEQHEMAGGNVVLANSGYNKLRKSDASPIEDIFFHEYEIGIATSGYPAYSYPLAIANDVAYSITNGAYLPVPEFLWGYDATNDLRAQEKQYFHSSITRNGETKTFSLAPYMWHDDQALFETASSGKDKAAYRYSDVLLIAAEAIAQSEGVTSEAVDYLSQVRGRAYWKTDINLINLELLTLSPEQFVEEVWEERFRELPFEFHTWFDMVRTRKFPETSAAANGEITFVEMVGQVNHWGKTFEQKHLLFPIPEPEIQRNPEFGEQNPGYTP